MTDTEDRKNLAARMAREHGDRQLHAVELKDKGYSNVAIGKELGVSESSVRRLLQTDLSDAYCEQYSKDLLVRVRLSETEAADMLLTHIATKFGTTDEKKLEELTKDLSNREKLALVREALES